MSMPDQTALANQEQLLFAGEGDELLFADEKDEAELTATPIKEAPAWKVMIVDDDKGIHDVTRYALEKFRFEERPLTFISAYSGEEAKRLMVTHPDTALMLLDVIMETNDAGLQVARYIREQLKNQFVRIILRTGQPGESPEEAVIVTYDINDYKTKTELTRQKLFTTMVATLRSYRDIIELARQREELQTLNEQLRQEMEERKKLEAIRFEQERLRLENEFLERQSQELARLNADKDKFFSIVAHDLRGPFDPVLGFSTTLMKLADTVTREELKQMAGQIHYSARNVYNLLENLLQWSRLQRGRIEHQPASLDLKQMADQTIRLLSENAAQKKITLCNRVEQGILVRADENMLDIVIRNLTSNALKFTVPGGRITITARPSEKREADKKAMVQLSISDTGVGMSRQSLEKLFKINVHHTTPGTGKEQGTGLGLIICKEMVEKNGGEIWLESEPGQGTTAHLTIPLEDSKYATAAWGQGWLDPVPSEERCGDEPAIEVVPPPHEELAELLHLATIGNMIGVQRYAARLEKSNPEFAPFAVRIGELASNFEEEQLLALIGQYMKVANQPTVE